MNNKKNKMTLVTFEDNSNMSGKNRARLVVPDRLTLRFISDHPVCDEIIHTAKIGLKINPAEVTEAARLTYKKMGKTVTELRYTLNLNSPNLKRGH